MKTARWISGVVLGVFSLISVNLVTAEDWPQWRGANRDARVTGFTPPATWPKELTKQWSAKVGSGDATPALVGDRLYAFGRQDLNEVTTCLSAADGKVIGIVADAKPYSEKPLGVSGDSAYVLEVKGGWCDRHGVKPGDTLDFRGFTPHAAN